MYAIRSIPGSVARFTTHIIASRKPCFQARYATRPTTTLIVTRNYCRAIADAAESPSDAPTSELVRRFRAELLPWQ